MVGVAGRAIAFAIVLLTVPTAQSSTWATRASDRSPKTRSTSTARWRAVSDPSALRTANRAVTSAARSPAPRTLHPRSAPRLRQFDPSLDRVPGRRERFIPRGSKSDASPSGPGAATIASALTATGPRRQDGAGQLRSNHRSGLPRKCRRGPIACSY